MEEQGHISFYIGHWQSSGARSEWIGNSWWLYGGTFVYVKTERHRAETGRETEMRLDSIYEAYKGDACHCPCHLALSCVTDKRMMKCFPEYPVEISALWKPQIYGIAFLWTAEVGILDLALRFELVWSKIPKTCIVWLQGPQQQLHHCIDLLLLCCPTWWRSLNLGNPRSYSFPGFLGLKY